MIMFNNKKTRHFISGVVVVALIVGVIMTRAIIGGVIDEYHIPFSQWPADLYLTQCFMIVIYTAVFTGLLSIPLWYFFLGESDDKN
ncbi:membrane protein [Tatumella morbirosei]|uniref:Membrane protein n=2 Tax=Tatumella morbirosei TaxID=642227 RepID=A0A095VCF4_9GAMM|nr:membrane protein [Tatumella morbirosei]